MKQCLQSSNVYKEKVTQKYYIPSKCHSSINANGSHSQLCKNSRNVVCMHASSWKHELYLIKNWIRIKNPEIEMLKQKLQWWASNPHKYQSKVTEKLWSRMDCNHHNLYKETILTNTKMVGGEKEVRRSTTVLVWYFLVGHQSVVSKIKIWCFLKHSNSNS